MTQEWFVQKKGSLAMNYPQLIEEWHPTRNSVTPHEVTSGSHKKAWWKCKHGHEWKAVIRYRVRGIGCP
jgi:hypothetical protein